LKISTSQQSSILKVEDVIRSEFPTLATLNKQDWQKLHSALNALISDCALFVNVGKQMTTDQVKETSELIKKEFYFLKIEDLKIFFSKFKSGFYGQLFDRLDGHVIMEALRKYCEERMEVAERINLQSHNELTDEQKLERYFVKTGENYIKEVVDGYMEIKEKDLATGFDFKKAVYTKNLLQKIAGENEKFKIVHSNRSEIGLIQYIKEKNPELAEKIPGVKEQNYKEKVAPYFSECELIMADETLSDLEKENKKRALVYLEPLTQKDFEKRQKQMLGVKQ